MKKLIVIFLEKKCVNKALQNIVNYTGDYRLEFSNDFDYNKPFNLRMENACQKYEYAAIVGNEEFKQDAVKLINLKNGEQRLVKYYELYENLK